MKLAVIGGGSWGTALAIALADRRRQIKLWVREPELVDQIRGSRENNLFLPGFQVPEAVEITGDLAEAVRGAEIVLSVVPSRYMRAVCTEMLPELDPGVALVSATKGLEQGTLLRMSEVITHVVEARFSPRLAVLSGPTFAREVAKGDPAAVVISSAERQVALEVQQKFSGPKLRFYANFDPVGVELGAALKNVIAIGAGICTGLGLGSNTLAALITRGLAEMTRLAEAMGGDPRTMAGLAGLGDLVLTCNGALSRNRTVGLELAKGRSIKEITDSMRMVAEGVFTCAAAVELGERCGVELPIIQEMQGVLEGKETPADAVENLMTRSLKIE